MKTYQLEPQAPLVFRSGKPFGEGSRDGANFPWPSSLAGLMRTVHWDATNPSAPPEKEAAKALLKLASAGPLLARRERGNLTPMFPKPADALYLLKDEKKNQEKAVFRLLPGTHEADCGSDLPHGLHPIVAEACAPKAKPQDGPEYWTLEQLLAWRRGDKVEFAALEQQGYSRETRTHVAINRTTFAADPGRLFQTEGLDFSPRRHPEGKGYDKFDWVFLARSTVDVEPQMVTFGGERRLSWLQRIPAQDPLALPEAHRKALQASRKISLTLVTPALFGAGWQPGWKDGEVPGVPGLQLKLVAAAVERWQGISGWDLLNKQAKAARKAVAAGATYWFEIIGEPPADWAEKLWLIPISDEAQDRRDGFGLVIPGIWK